jgi:hypothetical protein
MFVASPSEPLAGADISGHQREEGDADERQGDIHDGNSLCCEDRIGKEYGDGRIGVRDGAAAAKIKKP